MQFAYLFWIFWCTLYISVESSAETDTDQITENNDDEFNPIIENAIATDEVVMLRGKKNKAKGGPVRNCLDLKKMGKKSGTYTINPCDDMPSKAVNVYCDMDTDGGGWTVIQRRDNYPKQENFNKTWSEYLMGFGDVTKDFWLGNENIHCLTKQCYNEIRFDLGDWKGTSKYAKYGFFYVHDKATKFKLEAKNYSGTAGDSLDYHYGRYFSTYDADNDSWSRNCASTYAGAWWHGSCYYSNLNGLYNRSVAWGHYTWSLKKSDMKIRPKYN